MVPGRHQPGRPRGAGGDERAPVLAVVALLALLVLGWPLAGLVSGTGTSVEAPWASPARAGEPVHTESVHVVQPGETYWSIAERLGRPGDLRATVDALVEANDGRPLRVGEAVVVPMSE